jgi:hypothetical protein
MAYLLLEQATSRASLDWTRQNPGSSGNGGVRFVAWGSRFGTLAQGKPGPEEVQRQMTRSARSEVTVQEALAPRPKSSRQPKPPGWLPPPVVGAQDAGVLKVLTSGPEEAAVTSER